MADRRRGLVTVDVIHFNLGIQHEVVIREIGTVKLTILIHHHILPKAAAQRQGDGRQGGYDQHTLHDFFHKLIGYALNYTRKFNKK